MPYKLQPRSLQLLLLAIPCKSVKDSGCVQLLPQILLKAVFQPLTAQREMRLREDLLTPGLKSSDLAFEQKDKATSPSSVMATTRRILLPPTKQAVLTR